MTRPEAVILDIDGTLIDSNDAHARAFVEAAEEIGVDHPGFGEIRRMIGMGGDKLIPKAFGFAEESAEGTRLANLKGRIFRERLLPGLLPTPGARTLLERLRADGYVLVVATSADGDDLEALLKQAGLQDLVEGATTASDVESSKPAPDAIQAALKEARTRPDRAIMIGDTPYDVVAARRAGVPVVAFRCGGWSDEALAGAIAVFDDPADLLAHYEETLFTRSGDGPAGDGATGP